MNTNKRSERLRVLRVTHSAVVDLYLERERWLAREFGVEMLVLKPHHWPHMGARQQNGQEPFSMKGIRTFLAGSPPLFTFDPFAIANAISTFNPEIIDIHEEPYSASCFETVWIADRICPKVPRIFYSAQNIKKDYPPPFSITERYVYKKCAAAYPCSLSVEKVLRDKGFDGPAPIIGLGVDEKRFSPDLLGAEERANFRKANKLDNFVVGYFGRLEQCKGIEYLLTALQMIPPDFHWTLLIVGNGPEEDKILPNARLLGIENNIVFMGERAAAEIPTLLSCCDAVVIPSITTPTWKEQFGRIAVESMSCQIPVVASDSGSLPEVVGDGGMIVRERDARQICDGLLKIAKDGNYRKQLQTKGRTIVLERFTWKRIAEQMYELYTCVLSERH